MPWVPADAADLGWDIPLESFRMVDENGTTWEFTVNTSGTLVATAKEALLTEGGDDLIDEAGGRLLLE